MKHLAEIITQFFICGIIQQRSSIIETVRSIRKSVKNIIGNLLANTNEKKPDELR